MTENEKLARQAVYAMLKFMAFKWTIIIVLNKLAKRAIKKMEENA